MYMENMEEKTDGSGNYPLAEDALKEIHKELKESVEEKFRKEAMGDNVEAYLAQLRDKIKDKYADKKADNRIQFEHLLSTSLNNYYGKIDQKLKAGEVKNYFEFEKEMRNLRSCFMDLDFQGPNKEFLINDYILKKNNEVAHFLIKNTQAEYENQISILKDNKDKLESELFEIGETNMKEKNELGLQLFEAQNKKNDIEMKSNLVASRLEELKNEKQEIEDELRTKMESEKESMRSQIGGYQAKLHDSDAMKRKIEKELIVAKSESEKDMALLSQKVGFLEKQQSIY